MVRRLHPADSHTRLAYVGHEPYIAPRLPRELDNPDEVETFIAQVTDTVLTNLLAEIEGGDESSDEDDGDDTGEEVAEEDATITEED